MQTAVVCQQEAMVTYLLGRGADHTLRDPQYRATPLGWANYHGLDAIAALLRAGGADVGDAAPAP